MFYLFFLFKYVKLKAYLDIKTYENFLFCFRSRYSFTGDACFCKQWKSIGRLNTKRAAATKAYQAYEAPLLAELGEMNSEIQALRDGNTTGGDNADLEALVDKRQAFQIDMYEGGQTLHYAVADSTCDVRVDRADILQEDNADLVNWFRQASSEKQNNAKNLYERD